MLAAVEATLLGKDERLVAKCDVPGILAVFECWDIYDVDTSTRSLQTLRHRLRSCKETWSRLPHDHSWPC